MQQRTVFALLFQITLFYLANGHPKKYMPEDGGFQPSQNRYYESELPTKFTNSSVKLEAKEAKDASDRLRFGSIATYGTSGSGITYPGGNGMGYVMTPMKIDLGGVALGALIGLGAILIAPKLASLLGGAHGYRSIENDISSVTNILSRIDNSLEQHNIDSTSCMSRIVCSYVNEAQKNINNGEAGTIDQFVHTLVNNSLFTYMLDGTTVKQAVDLGKTGDWEKCESFYSKCPVNRENIMKVISSLLPA